MALNMRSSFLGSTLKAGPASSTPQIGKVQTQALFGRKKPEKVAKSGTIKLGGAVKQAQKVAKNIQKEAPKKFQKEAKKVERKAGGGFPSLPNLQKEAKKVQRQAPKLPSFKKEVKKVQRAAPSPPRGQVKKAQRKVGKATKGWLGGEGGAQSLDKWYGPDRALFLPGGLLDPNDVPSYLNGSLAGDYGYDPLGLGKDPSQVETYRAYELLHARWAMLAAAGIIIPEGLQANGASIKGGTWFETGAEMLNGGTLDYFAVPWAVVDNPLPLVAVVAIEVVLMGAVEKFRKDGTGPAGYSPGVGKFDSNIFDGLDNLYPGGPFDPLGLADDPEVFAELKVKEIKNGRLAMVAVLGFAVQSYVTGAGPYENWSHHVSDPFGYNLLSVIGNEDRIPTL